MPDFGRAAIVDALTLVAIVLIIAAALAVAWLAGRGR